MLFDRVADREDSAAVDFVFHEHTYGISRDIMQAEEIAPLQFGMFCNSLRDYGPADWHRDIRPPQHGSVEAYYSDFIANPSSYMQ